MAFQPGDVPDPKGDGVLDTGNVQDQPPAGPAYVTEDRLLELINPIIEKEVQRRADKFDNRAGKLIAQEVQKQLSAFDERLAAARQAGLKITDAKAAQMRQAEEERIAEQIAQGKLGQDAAPQPPSQPAPEEDVEPTPEDFEYEEKVTETKLKMTKLSRQLGFRLTERDPETRQVPWDETDPDKFYPRFEQAMRAKAVRLGTQQPPAQTRQAPPQQTPARNPAARSFALGNSNLAQTTVDSLQTELDQLQNKSYRTDEEWKRMKELTEEIRKAYS